MPPIDRKKAEKRFKQAHYISNLNSNRPEIMKKIHKVSYAEIFSDNFDAKKIDENLKHMEIEEKLYLLDNIIDYLYYNFKALRRREDGPNQSGKSELKKRDSVD